MSNRALDWAWSLSKFVDPERRERRYDLDPTAKLVLLRLADRANAYGECFPGIESLVEDTGRSRRTVQRALQALEDERLITREPPSGRRSTRYRLAIDGLHHGAATAPTGVTTTPLQEAHEVSPRHPRGVTTTPEGCHDDRLEVSSRHPNPNEPSEEPPPNHAYEPTDSVDAFLDRIDERWMEIGRRAGALHVVRCHSRGDEIRSRDGLARYKAEELRRDRSQLLDAVAARDDLDLDAAAEALLDGTEPPRRNDPRGVFLPGTGWVQ